MKEEIFCIIKKQYPEASDEVLSEVARHFSVVLDHPKDLDDIKQIHIRELIESFTNFLATPDETQKK